MNSHRDQENIYLCWDTGELNYLLAALQFSEASPCDMFQGEFSYLLSSPLCIALLIVCSYVPPLLRTVLQERERERERERETEREKKRDTVCCDLYMGVRLQTPEEHRWRCCHHQKKDFMLTSFYKYHGACERKSAYTFLLN